MIFKDRLVDVAANYNYHCVLNTRHAPDLHISIRESSLAESFYGVYNLVQSTKPSKASYCFKRTDYIMHTESIACRWQLM